MPSEVRRLGLFAWFSVLLVSLLRHSMNCGGNSDLPRDALKFPTTRTDVHSCFWPSWVTPWQFELSSWEFVVFDVALGYPFVGCLLSELITDHVDVRGDLPHTETPTTCYI